MLTCLCIKITEGCWKDTGKEFFKHWIDSVADTLTEMIENHQLDESINPKKNAESIVAMIEGGILLMVSQQYIQILQDVFEVIKQQYYLNER